MSDININQVLAQMRALSAAARADQVSTKSQDVADVDFGKMLSDTLKEVNESQKVSRDLSVRFESGDTSVDLPEVMIAMQKASISFQAVTEVRNKLLSAYQEVMNMQV